MFQWLLYGGDSLQTLADLGPQNITPCRTMPPMCCTPQGLLLTASVCLALCCFQSPVCGQGCQGASSCAAGNPLERLSCPCCANRLLGAAWSQFIIILSQLMGSFPAVWSPQRCDSSSGNKVN